MIEILQFEVSLPVPWGPPRIPVEVSIDVIKATDVGKALVITAGKVATELGFKRMKLRVEKFRQPAIALYKQLGFHQT